MALLIHLILWLSNSFALFALIADFSGFCLFSCCIFSPTLTTPTTTTLSLIYSRLYITSHWLCGLEIFLSLREVVSCPVYVWGSELFLGLLLKLLSQICDTLHIWISNMTYLKWLVIWLILSVAKSSISSIIPKDRKLHGPLSLLSSHCAWISLELPLLEGMV